MSKSTQAVSQYRRVERQVEWPDVIRPDTTVHPKDSKAVFLREIQARQIIGSAT
jgi:hypothetical protein